MYAVQIDDIKEPVVDQMGYVYEKSFILQHLKNHPNSKCPVPGIRECIPELVWVGGERRRLGLMDAVLSCVVLEPATGTTHRLKESVIKPHARLLSERRRKERDLRHNQKATSS